MASTARNTKSLLWLQKWIVTEQVLLFTHPSTNFTFALDLHHLSHLLRSKRALDSKVFGVLGYGLLGSDLVRLLSMVGMIKGRKGFEVIF